MAKYTIELSSLFSAMVTAYGKKQENSVLPLTPIQAINDDELVKKFFADNVGYFPYQVSTDEATNQQFLVTFERNFLRHFYSLEISQTNPLSWFILLSDFLNSEMPRFIKQYQALDKNNWLSTNSSESNSKSHSTANQTGNSKSNQLNANADTPQNELDFGLGSNDPTSGYNFKYASVVAGAKSGTQSVNDALQDSEASGTTSGRNASIMQLITELDTFANGTYLNLWERALKQYHLFIGVMA